MMIKRIFMCFVVDVIIIVSISGGAFAFLKTYDPKYRPSF